MKINISDNASRRIMGLPLMKFHIHILLEGCSGTTFTPEFRNDIMADAIIIDDNGCRIYLNSNGYDVPDGVLDLDFEDTLIGSRFVITSPMYESCNCGNSFRVGGLE